MDKDVMDAARLVWDYHHVHHELRRADCIMALGSNDIRVAEHAARLYLGGWAPLVVMSGGLGNFTKGKWEKPEGDTFKDAAVAAGVPPERILVENRSTNTGENVRFTRAMLGQRGLSPASFILVQKPFMERRTLATFEKVWPGPEIVVKSPPIPFEQYPNEAIPLDDLLHTMVGDLQRVMVYPAKGFQTRQAVPEDVHAAYAFLVRAGYTRHLMPGEAQIPPRP
ncbi:MAG: YdcF family protein [Candidatus Lokiarchaeota archaeon]|nr:YdcF family protein [Candidatus Lokiarchaeota archaeon]